MLISKQVCLLGLERNLQLLCMMKCGPITFLSLRPCIFCCQQYLLLSVQSVLQIELASLQFYTAESRLVAVDQMSYTTVLYSTCPPEVQEKH